MSVSDLLVKAGDGELGLVYYNWRYYNAAVGRWNSRDKEYNDNPYHFTRNNATFAIDELGLKEFSFNEQSCALTLKLELEIDFVKSVRFGYDEIGFNTYYVSDWDNSSIGDAEKHILDSINSVWHNKYKLTTNNKCCPCEKTGINILLEFVKGEYLFPDVKFIVVRENPEYDSINGHSPRAYAKGRKIVIRSNSSSRTINHEFGHILGLTHPGVGLPIEKRHLPDEAKALFAKNSDFKSNGINDLSSYIHTGTDRYGREVSYHDLMGLYGGMREFYFEKWQNYMTELCENCAYSVKKK